MGEEVEDLEAARGREVGCVGVWTERFVGVGLARKNGNEGRSALVGRVSFPLIPSFRAKTHQIPPLHISRKIPKLLIMRIPQLSFS